MTRRRVAAAFAIGSLAALASWLALFVMAGDVGLQRSVGIRPSTLLEQPLALGAMAVVAFAVALIGSLLAGVRDGWAWALRVLAVVLVTDLFGAAVPAPLLVGELEVIDTPVVFAAISGLGLQPLAATVGAWLGARRRARP